MRVDLVFPVLPPAINGIGDHTALLAATLADRCDVRVLTTQQGAAIPGVIIEQAFSLDTPRGVQGLLRAVAADPPDWLVVQFEQFAYGRWGLNPYLPLVVRTIKRTYPQTRFAFIAHEDFVPVTSWKFAIMTTWQRWQFWMLGTQADLIFFSIEPWVHKYRSWFSHAPVGLLPSCSNIPLAATTRCEARRRIGVEEHTFVAGVFGTVNASRMLSFIRRAAAALHRRTKDFAILYVGPHGKEMRAEMGTLPLIDAGPLPADEVSWHLAAMDIHLTPFIDGVSTRRGSFMAGIQHGIPTVSTEGILTDGVLKQANGDVFLLASVEDPEAFERHAVTLLEDAGLRRHMAASSRAFYQASFSKDVIASRFLAAIGEMRDCMQEIPS